MKIHGLDLLMIRQKISNIRYIVKSESYSITNENDVHTLLQVIINKYIVKAAISSPSLSIYRKRTTISNSRSVTIHHEVILFIHDKYQQTIG